MRTCIWDEILALRVPPAVLMAPIEERGEDLPYHSVDALLERARGLYANGRTKEGIVIRPQAPVYSQTIGASLSMKVINNDYLVKKAKKG